MIPQPIVGQLTCSHTSTGSKWRTELVFAASRVGTEAMALGGDNEPMFKHASLWFLHPIKIGRISECQWTDQERD
jgi:hypothetical protein